MINKKLSGLCILAIMLFSAGIYPVQADDISWHQQSENYDVYLGVIPVRLLRKDLSLIDSDKSLHGGVSKKSNNQHVMVSIYSRSDGKRILNATVIAKVGLKKILGGNNIEKPLEKMTTSGQIAYGNFFPMPDKGNYRINVEIYRSNKSGSEEVAFTYKIP